MHSRHTSTWSRFLKFLNIQHKIVIKITNTSYWKTYSSFVSNPRIKRRLPKKLHLFLCFTRLKILIIELNFQTCVDVYNNGTHLIDLKIVVIYILYSTFRFIIQSFVRSVTQNVFAVQLPRRNVWSNALLNCWLRQITMQGFSVEPEKSRVYAHNRLLTSPSPIKSRTTSGKKHSKVVPTKMAEVMAAAFSCSMVAAWCW